MPCNISPLFHSRASGEPSINALAVTAITDLILASEALFFAGMLMQLPKKRMSAAWLWSFAMAFLGLAGLIGGIDHGFIEPAGLSRAVIQRANWLVLGAMTLCVVLTIAAQFFRGRTARLVQAAGIVQFLCFIAAAFLADSYIVVIVNYAPVMAWFLVMNMLRLKQGEGSWQMIAGSLVLFLASAVQALGIDVLTPLDHNGLYHVISMPGVFLLFLGGRRLQVLRTA